MDKNSLIRQMAIMLIVLVLLFISAMLLNLFWKTGTITSSYAYGSTSFLSPVASLTTSPTAVTVSQPSNQIDINIFISIVTALLGGLAGAILAPFISHYLQWRKEVKVAKEQLRQQEKEKDEATKTTIDRIQAYCENLRINPRIAYLQILDMSQPIEVKSIYIWLRLYYEEAVFEEEIDQELVITQKLHDPDASLQARGRHLEYRTSKALDPGKAINKYKHCVIVGDPGAGKTTLLKHLIIKSLDKELEGLPSLPLYIELNAFANSKVNDLLEFAATEWTAPDGFTQSEAQAFLAKELKQGNMLVLLDGLDETFIGEGEIAEKTYGRVYEAIKAFAKRYSQSPIVVTVRKARYHFGAGLEGFTELIVLDFRPEDIQQFVNKWFARDPKGEEKAKGLNNKLIHNPRTHALVANPLLLALITITYDANPDLLEPKDLNRADIYEKCVETLLFNWDVKRRIKRSREFNLRKVKRLLEGVAFYFHKQGQLYFSEKELLKVIASILPVIHLVKEDVQEEEAEDLAKIILTEITSNNGLLKEQTKERYGFLHLIFQEYFVAQQLADQDISEILLAHSDEPWWEEVILLTARYTRDASISLQTLMQKNKEKIFEEIIFHTDLILAGRYMAISSAIETPSLRNQIIFCLLGVLKKTPYSLTQQQVVSTLVELNKIDICREKINERLIELLYDQQVDRNARGLVIEALEIAGDRAICDQLVKLLSNSPIDIDEGILKRIAVKLGTLEDGSQIGELYKLLSDIKVNVDTRRSIVEALGLCGGKEVIDKLVNVLMQQPDDWTVQAQIIGVLSKLGDATIAPQLRSLLSNKNIDQQLRIHIITALGNLNDHSGISELLRLLIDPTTGQKERECIVDSLGKLGDDSLLLHLRRAQYKPEISMDVYQCITIVMVKLGDASQADDLLRLLHNPTVSLNIRQSALSALVKLNDKSIVNPLLQILPGKEHDPLVKKWIVDILGTSGDQTLTSALKPLFFSPNTDPDIRGHIAVALELLGEDSIEVLPLLSNEEIDVQVRQRIADSLGVFGKHSQIPEMLELLSETRINKEVRKYIAKAISQLAHDEKTVGILANLLYSSDIQDDIHRALWKVSRAARVSLSMVNGPSGKQIDIRRW